MNNDKYEKTEVPWYVNWFDKNYLRLYGHRNLNDAIKQVELISKVLKPKKDCRMLDLGCGDGRYTYLFSQQGFDITGLDLSDELINEAKSKYGDLNLIIGDMRNFTGEFDIILSLFTSFGYFMDDKENLQVFRAVNAALKRNGWFWLDFLNSDFVKDNVIPETVTEVSSVCRVIERRKIEKNRIIKDIFFVDDKEEKHYQESVLLYSKVELEIMFKIVGLTPVDCFGDYSGKKWSSESERTIIYGRKID
jgi:SAM-dependent methyltransferase